MSIAQDPFGRAYRSGRLTDEETAERMLKTAVGRVNEDGLRVSFDLLRFEDLIADAGVARSAVYRRWPTKNHFYADLLLELAGYQHPAMAAYDENTVALSVRLALENLEQMRTPEGRRSLAVELARQGALQNYTALIRANAWSVYVTLTATLGGLPDTPLQGKLQEALQRSEQGFIAKMSMFYATMLKSLGFRLRPELAEATLESLAQLGGAVVEGLSINTIAMPEVAERRFYADPFGTGQKADWSLPALGFTSIVMTFTELDPACDGVWTDAEIEARRLALESFRP